MQPHGRLSHVLGSCAWLYLQVGTTRARLSPGIQFGTGLVVQVPPYRGLYHCTNLCLLTCTTLYRSVPPRCKPIDIWLPLVQGGTNWYNKVSCRWYKGRYKAFRFVPLGEVMGRLQRHHKGVGNTHRKPLIHKGFTAHRNITTNSEARLYRPIRGGCQGRHPVATPWNTCKPLLALGYTAYTPLALTRGCLLTGVPCRSLYPCRSPHAHG